MASTKRRCAYCGQPTKRHRACANCADVERIERELNGDLAPARSPLAGSAETRQDDAPTDPPGGAP